MEEATGLHHAYLLVGELPHCLNAFEDYLTELGVESKANPDLRHFSEPLFGIDEARRLSDESVRKAFGRKKVFLISSEKISIEAQNALLKTFEDPVADTHFFVAVREEGLLVSTLISRMRVVRIEGDNSPVSTDEMAIKFLAKAPADRLDWTKKFEETEGPVTLGGFLDSLMSEMKARKMQPKAIQNVFNLRRYAADRAVSARLILEHLAVTL